MNTQAALTCAEEVRDFATDRRVSAELRLEERFRKAKEARELPSDTDCAALTRYFTSVEQPPFGPDTRHNLRA